MNIITILFLYIISIVICKYVKRLTYLHGSGSDYKLTIFDLIPIFNIISCIFSLLVLIYYWIDILLDRCKLHIFFSFKDKTLRNIVKWFNNLDLE